MKGGSFEYCMFWFSKEACISMRGILLSVACLGSQKRHLNEGVFF